MAGRLPVDGDGGFHLSRSSAFGTFDFYATVDGFFPEVSVSMAIAAMENSLDGDLFDPRTEAWGSDGDDVSLFAHNQYFHLPGEETPPFYN